MPVVRKQTPAAKKTTTDGELSAWDFDSGLKINVFGRSGTGKTRLWSTFPGPILAAICSGSVKSGELRSIDTPENRRKITAVPVTSAEAARQFVARAKGETWGTVVLDHVSGLQDLLLKEILGIDEIPAQMSWGTATQEQWGMVGVKVKEIVRALIDVPANVVIVAQERQFGGDEYSSDQIVPSVMSDCSPSTVRWLNHVNDYIVRTYSRRKTVEKKETIAGKPVTRKVVSEKEVEFCLRTAPDPVYGVKFRVAPGLELPQEIVDPSYDKIMAVIEGRWKGE